MQTRKQKREQYEAMKSVNAPNYIENEEDAPVVDEYANISVESHMS